MRYSSSMLAAVFICFFVFLGMSLLVSTPKYTKSTQIEIVSFSKIADMDDPTVKPVKPLEPPKKEQVVKPPVAPPIDISSNPTDRAELIQPLKPGVLSKNSDFFSKPSLNIPKGFGGNGGGKSGDMQQIFPIYPRYPQKALINKIEGWVKVEFTVNELGRVVNAKVIDSKPRRIFDKNTLRALQKSKFKPMIVDGKPVPQKAVQVIEFKLAQ